jgi:hypothetical protein
VKLRYFNPKARVVIIVALSSLVGLILVGILLPGTGGTAPGGPVSPQPVSTPAPSIGEPTPTSSPAGEDDYTRKDNLRASSAFDMAMAVVAATTSIDYQRDPVTVLQSVRDFTAPAVQQQLADRLSALDWDTIVKQQYVLYSDVTNAVPIVAANASSSVPQRVEVTVNLFELSRGVLTLVGTQTWSVTVGSGGGADGWVATRLELLSQE